MIKMTKEEIAYFDGDIMVYKDNMACWNEEEGVIRRLVTSFANNLKEAGLEKNVDKTVIINVSRGE